MPNKTFGFEAEFDTNVPELTVRLHEMGIVGDAIMHGYHCGCEWCDYRDGYPLRVQRDSSCSGEVISKILTFDDDVCDPVDLMLQLQTAAVDTDAEPGVQSGFHVHVNRRDIERAGVEHDALWNFMRWEQTLERIAAGRFTRQRDNNTRLRQMHRYAVADTVQGRDYNLGQYVFEEPSRYLYSLDVLAIEREMSRHPEEFDLLKRDLVDYHLDSDRHSNLNINTSSNRTWEFRLWNSTRSAWRMELFVRLSLAFVDPSFVGALLSVDTPNEANLGECLRGFDDRAALLLDRQVSYDAEAAPATLTLV